MRAPASEEGRSVSSLRWEWHESGLAAGFIHPELRAFLEAKWDVSTTSDLTDEQLIEDVEFFQALIDLGAERVA